MTSLDTGRLSTAAEALVQSKAAALKHATQALALESANWTAATSWAIPTSWTNEITFHVLRQLEPLGYRFYGHAFDGHQKVLVWWGVEEPPMSYQRLELPKP